jgi:hypothetical protein
MDIIEDTLMKKLIDKELVGNIINGKFTPVKYSEKKLEEKYLKIERDEKIAKRGSSKL